MEILANKTQKNIERKEKMQNFLNIATGTIILLGIASIPATILKNINENYLKEQQYLQSIEENPLVYQEKQVDGCQISYIESSYKNQNDVYEQDLYLKTNCEGQISITKVKEKINTSRMKLAQKQTTDIKKNNM